MGLVIWSGIGLYLLLVVLAVRWAITYARSSGKSVMRWGWGMALAMYLIPMWDWLPTVAVHRYYCATEAGFWTHKTLDQWKVENPGVIATLHRTHQPKQQTSFGHVDILDERFAIETRRIHPFTILPTTIFDRRLVDRKTGEVLKKAIEVGSGVGSIATGGGAKFWLTQEPCIQAKFWTTIAQLEEMRGTK